jgi:hypothetical protein
MGVWVYTLEKSREVVADDIFPGDWEKAWNAKTKIACPKAGKLITPRLE